MLSDLRHAFRSALRRPSLPLVAIAILSLGIAASTLTFSVVDGVLWSELPYRDYDRLVHIFEARPDQDPNRGVLVSLPTFEDFQAESKTIEAFARIPQGSLRDFVLIENDRPLELMFNTLSPDAMRLLGTQPILGRPFVEGDEQALLLRHEFWQSYFNGSTDVVGKTLDFVIGPFTVVGVMPPNFEWPAQTWTDERSDQQAGWVIALENRASLSDRSQHNQHVIGRLRAGVTEEQARAEIAQIAQRVGERHPETNEGWGSRLIAIHSRYHKYHGQKAILLAILAAVGSVLLIGCANVAGLLLSRANERSRELAVRSALGAGRGRIASQLLAESLLYAGVAGALGLSLAVAGLEAVKAQLSALLPRVDLIELNTASVAFALAATLLTGALCGLIPAWRASRRSQFDHLRQSGAGGGDARTSAWLAASQLALSTVLVGGAGLALQSFAKLTDETTGFDLERLLAVRVPVDWVRDDVPRARRFHREVVERVRALPGVEAAGLVNERPFRSNAIESAGMGTNLEVEGQEALEFGPRDPDRIRRQSAGPGYFEAAGMRLVHGRDFTDADDAGSAQVTVVNESLAELLWPGQNPVGKRLRRAAGPLPAGPWREVVGVVSDAKLIVAADPLPMVFDPMAQLSDDSYWMTRQSALMVRTATPPSAMASAVKDAIFELDPEMPVTTESVTRIVERAIAPARFGVWVGASLAASALLLALVGAFSVLASLVNARRHEIGIRMALGADRRTVLGSVISRAARIGIGGAAIGLLGAVAVGRYLESRLYAVSAVDPSILASIAAVVTATVAVAAFVPARRAARVDPSSLLRHE